MMSTQYDCWIIKPSSRRADRERGIELFPLFGRDYLRMPGMIAGFNIRARDMCKEAIKEVI